MTWLFPLAQQYEADTAELIRGDVNMGKFVIIIIIIIIMVIMRREIEQSCYCFFVSLIRVH